MKTTTSFPLALLLTLLVVGACTDHQPVAPDDQTVIARQAPAGFHGLVEMESAVGVNLQAVWGADENHVFAVGLTGTIQHFDGTKWTQQGIEPSTISVANAVWGSGPNDVWAVGGLGALFHYDGTGWTLVTRLRADNNVQYQLFGVGGTAADDVWAVGNSGTSHHFDGAGWTYQNVPTGNVLRAVWSAAPGDVFTVGDGGVLFHHAGEEWSAMESPTDLRLNAVHGRSATDVFAGGSFGMILHYDGEEWREDPQARRVTSAHIRDMWGDDAGNVFAAAWGGTVLRHDGREWEVLRTGTDVNLEGVWGTGNGRLFAVGAGGKVYRGGRGTGAGHAPPGLQEVPIWPIAGTTEFDADSIHSPYGPRMLPRGHDFHAGVDIPAPTGTPALTVLSGTVIETRTWDGESVGAGNAVHVRHVNGEATTYLHLDEIWVEVGDELDQSDPVGTVGSTGATYPHLHLGYFRTLNFANADERLSYNPLELLRHGNRRDRIGISFTDEGVALNIPLQRMRVQSIELRGGEDSRVVDYSAIVQRGITARRDPVQFGVHLDVERPTAGWFDLTLTPEDFAAERVIVTDIDGKIVVDERRR